MKFTYINITKVYEKSENSYVHVCGWVKNIRKHSHRQFIVVIDATGELQVILEDTTQLIPREAYVIIEGKVQKWNSQIEVLANKIDVIAEFSVNFSPMPHSNFDMFEFAKVDHLLSNRHIYLRHPQLMSVMKFRHKFFRVVHDLFEQDDFIEIHAPILTEAILYEENTAFKTMYLDDEIFLTQCVGFYLEAYVHAFDKIYNIGPSFRAESSKSRRHLSEYWHIKMEIAHANLTDLIQFVEKFISNLGSQLLDLAGKGLDYLNSPLNIIDLQPPYPQISYRDALTRLQNLGFSIEFGRSIPQQAEDILSKQFSTPFWIVGLPAKIEPFPYVLDPEDSEITKVADLHAPGGFGELLGVAEKIYQYDILLERAKNKQMSTKQFNRLKWYFELRNVACIPHGGIGMGVERTIRWLLNLPHVRDAIPFPRIFGRTPSP